MATPTSSGKLSSGSSGTTEPPATSLTQDGDWLQCLVCRDVFKDPWLLRCLHTFCQSCFDVRVEQEGKNECPVCQERDVFGHLKLRPDYAARYALEHGAAERRAVPCSGGPAGSECGRPAVSHCPTCAKYMCTGCHTVHLELSRAHRVQSLGEARADGKRAVCWLHLSQPLQYYCATCDVPTCQLCADQHPADHRRTMLEDIVSDEIGVFCATIDAQKRKVIDMKKILARQIRRHNEAYERCRRLVDEGHEVLVDVLPSGKDQVLLKLDEIHRVMKARLEKFGEKMLLLAGDVTHIISVMERQLQFGLNAEVLALKKPAESKLGVMNRKIDDHFSAEQAVAQSLLRNGGEIGREMMRSLYRPQVATDSRRASPVQTTDLRALNGFGSSPSGSSHGSSPELSLEQSLSRGSSYDHELLSDGRQSSGDLGLGFALPSELSALLNGNSSSDLFSHPPSSLTLTGISNGGGSNGHGKLNTVVGGLNGLSSLSNGLEHQLRLDDRSSVGSSSRPATGFSGLDLGSHHSLGDFNSLADFGPSRLSNGLGQSTSASSGGSGGGSGFCNGNAGGGLGQSILNGASGMERSFSGSYDSGFSGRFSPYSVNQYGRWSNGNDAGESLRPPSATGSQLSRGPPPAAPAPTPPYPPRGQIRRQKMIYNVKLGEFGVMEGQFTEPSGVAVNARNEIIVADTNNHRIQVFDKEGRFQFSFGECGKREGQLLYPNRVFVNKQSGDIVVTERSPTHQIQIYNQYGAFVRKFGADILQHPRGVTVDNKNRIVVVECKVMRVLVFDYFGDVLKRFGCSRHLEFPNGVAVNDKEEIFISDNRAHCVKVFSYEGQFLRKIGGEGVTNYPIGVGINLLGQVVIADNHNNFNLTVFTQEGQLISALESKVKHAQCFDMALMEGGSVVLASKDYRLYVYRYAPSQVQYAYPF
ncbi:Brain tumor protein [Amphibalanus amphitrite]|uniref:Brain tumor protein n=1 Tax=Amphibalanus amphitrite TaxID=1232801 RepID=A0A6A4W9S9_AMPAM|nr:Brain tumor protein [Amphibalanus amphitrite]